MYAETETKCRKVRYLTTRVCDRNESLKLSNNVYVKHEMEAPDCQSSTFGSLAQLAEHETFNFGVDGSNPSRITNIDVVQSVERGIWDAEVAGSSPVIYT